MVVGASEVEDQAEGGAGVVLKSEPITPVRDPPAHNPARDRGGQGPPERQDEVGEQAEDGEYDPEDFAFHHLILGRIVSSY